ncbi:MAG: uroporphyrinogen decarboxylase family protein [Bacillota bacterium]
MAGDALTPRERVGRAFNHEEPDRVPIDFGGKGSGLGLALYEELKDKLGVVSPTQVLDKRLGSAVVDESILKRFHVDTRYVYLQSSAKWDPRPDPTDGSFFDEWGGKLRCPREGLYYDHVEHPIKDPSVKAIERHRWPEPEDASRISGLRELARLYSESGYAVGTYLKGVWETTWILRGFENVLADLILNRKFLHSLLDKTTDILEGILSRLLDEVGDYLSFVCITCDLGTQVAPMLSKSAYEEFVRPREMRLFDLVKKKSPAKVAQHCCGSISELIPSIIEAGVEILNPIQVSAAGMEPSRLKREYGNELVFWGGS